MSVFLFVWHCWTNEPKLTSIHAGRQVGLRTGTGSDRKCARAWLYLRLFVCMSVRLCAKCIGPAFGLCVCMRAVCVCTSACVQWLCVCVQCLHFCTSAACRFRAEARWRCVSRHTNCTCHAHAGLFVHMSIISAMCRCACVCLPTCICLAGWLCVRTRCSLVRACLCFCLSGTAGQTNPS